MSNTFPIYLDLNIAFIVEILIWAVKKSFKLGKDYYLALEP